eukprot:3306347-Prymnesium_polylepis.1
MPPCGDGGAETVAVSFEFEAAAQTQAVPLSEGASARAPRLRYGHTHSLVGTHNLAVSRTYHIGYFTGDGNGGNKSASPR